MAEELSSDKEFIHEEIVKIIDDAIHSVFGIKENENTVVSVTYNKDKVNNWSNQIMDHAIRNLSKLYKPFKYCVTTVMQQNNGAMLLTDGCCYCDNGTDGTVSVQKEINDIVIICTVYAFVI